MRKKSLVIPFCPNGRGRGKRGVLWSFAIGTLFLVSCQQGFENNELFKSDVSNSQLKSPEQENISFSRVFNADGTQSVKVSWPVVAGASGYECIAKIVNDPAHPEEVYNDLVDGVSFSFPRERDKHYEVSIRPIGNTNQNNKDAETATLASLSTYLQPIQIESEDIASSIKSIMDKYGDPEYIFELESGTTYQINGTLDFGEALVTLKGSNLKSSTTNPIIKLNIDGKIHTSGGLTIESINFDCTGIESKGVIECSSNPDSKLIGPKNNAYILQNPIVIKDCMFKNIPMCLFYSGECAWGINDIRIENCIAQFDNDGTKFGDAAVICTYSGTSKFEGGASWNSLVRNISIKNSTIYNLQKNSKNRVIRFLSNNPSKVYETSDGSALIENCTFYKTFTDKEFANNTPNRAEYVITFNNNVLSEVYRLAKFIQGNNTKNVKQDSNTIWHTTQMGDSNTSAAKYATAEDPAFIGPVDLPLDLTKPNGGVNFKATGTISSTVGDPRWLN